MKKLMVILCLSVLAGCERYVDIDPSPPMVSAWPVPRELQGPPEHTLYRLKAKSGAQEGQEVANYLQCVKDLHEKKPEALDRQSTEFIEQCLSQKGYTVTLVQSVINPYAKPGKPALAFDYTPASNGRMMESDYLGCREKVVGPNDHGMTGSVDVTAPTDPAALDSIKKCMKALGYAVS